MTRRTYARLMSALVTAVMLGLSVPLLADTFLVNPKPEKKWMQYFYRANGNASAPKPSTFYTVASGVAIGAPAVGFTFTITPDTTNLLTGHPAYNELLLGDLRTKIVHAGFHVTASGPFTYSGQPTSGPNPCLRPANVRLYFATNSPEQGASQYWWSNPVSKDLSDGDETLTASLTPGSWSDQDGHLGTFNLAHMASFEAAAADVQQIGLSFGGGCLFSNGVGNTSATFQLYDFSVKETP